MNWRYLVWFPVVTIVLTAVAYTTKVLWRQPTWQQLLVVLVLAILSFVASWAGDRVLARERNRT